MKYELTDATQCGPYGCLRRIVCTESFTCPPGPIEGKSVRVEKGDLGGWVTGYDNLHQDGTCWLFGDAIAANGAEVSEGAVLANSARATDDAYIHGLSWIGGSALVSGNASVFDHACISGYAEVFGRACVYGHAKVGGNAIVCGNCEVSGRAIVQDGARILDQAVVSGWANIGGQASVGGRANVGGSAIVYGTAAIEWLSVIRKNAEIKKPGDCVPVLAWWIGDGDVILTYTRSNGLWTTTCPVKTCNTAEMTDFLSKRYGTAAGHKFAKLAELM